MKLLELEQVVVAILMSPTVHVHVQWNLSIPDTIGATKIVLCKEVSLFQRLINNCILR